MIKDIDSLFLGLISIEVAPEVLFSTSENILRDASQIKTKFERIKNIVGSTKTYWQGAVSDKERMMYENNYSNILEAIDRINNYANELKVISQNYVDAEASATQEAQSLPIDIIS